MGCSKTIGSRAEVMHGTAKKTSGGLTKPQLKYNKQGKIVSKKASALAKKNNRLVKAGYTTQKGVFGSEKMRGGDIKVITESDLRTKFLLASNTDKLVICKKNKRWFGKDTTTKLIFISEQKKDVYRIKKNYNELCSVLNEILSISNIMNESYEIIENTCNNLSGIKSVDELIKSSTPYVAHNPVSVAHNPVSVATNHGSVANNPVNCTGSNISNKESCNKTSVHAAPVRKEPVTRDILSIRDLLSLKTIKTINTGLHGHIFSVELHNASIIHGIEGILLEPGNYAIKEIYTEDFKNKEVVVQMRLSSKYIQKCYGYVTDYLDASNEFTYIILELCEGNDISKLLIGNKHLDVHTLYKWSIEILEGLEQMHNNLIAWRDLKDENIMLCGSGEYQDQHVKLIGFGLVSIPDSNMGSNMGRLLQGTPAYMAPECFERGPLINIVAGHQIDIFAFGILLCKMFTKIILTAKYDLKNINSSVIKLPDNSTFKSVLKQDSVYKIVNIENENDVFLPNVEHLERVKLREIIHKCTLRDTTQRYKHASEILIDFTNLTNDLNSRFKNSSF